jgi:hypothetical protein
MAKKNITFRIDEELITKLNELRGKKSQNSVIELLLNGWDGTTTSKITSNDLQLQLDTMLQVQSQLKAQSEILLQVQSQLKVMQSQVQVQSKDEYIIVDGIEFAPMEVLDESPPLPVPTMEDIYGKVEVRKEHVPDPNDPIEAMLLKMEEDY